METFSNQTMAQPTAASKREFANPSQSDYNPHNCEERGTLNNTIQDFYMPSVEEFINEPYY